MAETEQCRYLAAAYPMLDADDTCSEHRHDEATFSLARAMAAVFQQPDPTDEQVGWFMDDAAAVVNDDFDPAPAEWVVTEPQITTESGLDFTLTINGAEYVIQENDSGGHVASHPVARDEYRSWLCTCGMAEQERTGHAPQHEDWCELADDDADLAPMTTTRCNLRHGQHETEEDA